MKYPFTFLISFSLFLLSSCVEIIDDLSVNDDGSGTFKYNVNLSSSKVKINSILALDSLDGKKVPSLSEIERKINTIVEKLSEQKGIENVTFNSNYTDFIFKLSCDFKTLDDLQNAIREIALIENNQRAIPELDEAWITLEKNKLIRSVPEITIRKSKEINQQDVDLLRKGSYTSITRFEREIDHFENENARISKNKQAIMIRTDPYSLTREPQLLHNTIYIVDTESGE